VLSLVLAALFFAGIHLGIAGTAIRDRAIGLLGKNGYMAAFAIASLIGLGWLVAAYNRAPYLITWGMLEWWKPIVIILHAPSHPPGRLRLDNAKPDLGRAGRNPRTAATGDRPGYASSVSDGGRPLGAAASYWAMAMSHPWSFSRPGRS